MKTSILNKLNHKLQAHARVCKENKQKELEKMTAYENILQLKDQL